MLLAFDSCAAGARQYDDEGVVRAEPGELSPKGTALRLILLPDLR
jgi:hypothetical protein